MEAKEKFKIVYSDEVVNFLNALNVKVRNKIVYNINKSKYILDKDLFKKLDDTDIWEFRTMFDGMQYRLLAFWDTDSKP